MSNAGRRRCTAEEQERHGGAYKRLQKIIESAAPDAEEFRRALGTELAAGFPADWQNKNGWTPLRWAVDCVPSVRAGLPQVLIDAGADVNIWNDNGMAPLDDACLSYIYTTVCRNSCKR